MYVHLINVNIFSYVNALHDFLFMLRWLMRIFWYGRNHDLEMKDMYNVMPADSSELLGDKLEE